MGFHECNHGGKLRDLDCIRILLDTPGRYVNRLSNIEFFIGIENAWYRNFWPIVQHRNRRNTLVTTTGMFQVD